MAVGLALFQLSFDHRVEIKRVGLVRVESSNERTSQSIDQDRGTEKDTVEKLRSRGKKRQNVFERACGENIERFLSRRRNAR